MKRCWKCKTEKDESEFGKDRSRHDKLCQVCKVCSAVLRKEWREKNRDKVIEHNRKHNERHAHSRRAYSAEWYANNKEYFAEWREKNREAARRASKRYREANAEKVRQRGIEWRRINPNYSAMMRAKDPEKYRAIVRNRRARIKGVGGKHTAKDIAMLLRMQKRKCAVCKVSIAKKYDVDHVMPIYLGGSNDKSNLQLLCPSCNRRKHAKHPIEFMNEMGFLL